MDTLWPQMLLVAGLVLVNAAFAGSEIALITLRDSQLVRLAEQGRPGRTLAALGRDPNRFLSTIQIAMTLAGFLASATAAVTLAEPLVDVLAPLGAAARPTAVVVVVVALTFVTLVVGELAPKRLAMQRPERWALLVARPIAALAALSRPVVWLLGKATDGVVRLFGGDPARQRQEISEDELRDMVATQPGLGDEERAIIDGAFEFADRSLRQVLVPRTEVVAFPADTAAPQARDRLLSTGHSRAPVYEGDLDDVVGIVHLRDLVAGEGTAGEHARPALLLPETVGALDALRRMQAERQQLVPVVSEHGGVEGIVTIEDLLEELVGEIRDEVEHDTDVSHHADGSISVAGAFPVHELPAIGLRLPPGSYTSVAGVVLDRLGRLPEPGEVLVVDDVEIEVVAVTDRAIRRLRLRPRAG